MGDRSYIGVTAPGGVTARYLHHGDAPERLIPTLRAIWASFDRDSHRMTAALLAEDWSYLTADPQPTSPYTLVAGVGCPSPGGTRPRPARIRLNAAIGAAIGWLYVIDPDTAVVTVYEATVHDRWLRHSEHQLHPSETTTSSAPAAGNCHNGDEDFYWQADGGDMTGRQLLAWLQRLGEADATALNSKIELTCPDLEDPWNAGRVWRYSSVIMLAPCIEDDDESESGR
ncbi:hypothetical protein OHA21_38325 [Actinoplanes sp. NBC_00393]|uniref:hypothetical protein n=1 Tax=Actinoplanes sp. NBC_00393 TaxID=2975953 RepID=UPI002E1DA7A1